MREGGGLARAAAALQTAAEAAVRECAAAACARARELAPVDTGRLRGAIRAESRGTSATVTADCEYAAAVELGALHRPAQPFMAPAAREARDAFARIAAERARQALKGNL